MGHEMNWIILALISAIAFSAYAIVQKYAFQKYSLNVYVFGLLGGAVHLGIGTTILIINPLPGGWTSAPVMVVLAAGGFGAVVNLMISTVVRREKEISRIVPVVDTNPMFVAVLAIFFLGENLTPLKWLTVGMVLAGALIASLHQSLPGSRIKIGRSFFLLLAASFGMAVMTILVKYALGHLETAHVYALFSSATAPVYLAAVLLSKSWAETKRTIRNRNALSITGIAVGAQVIAFIAGMAALALGPVSLASALMGTRPLIVLVYMTFIGFFLPRILSEPSSRSSFMAKGTAAVLVTVGVGTMAFT
jgi:drug/metabolite transporter (DMT)-like permease